MISSRGTHSSMACEGPTRGPDSVSGCTRVAPAQGDAPSSGRERRCDLGLRRSAQRRLSARRGAKTHTREGRRPTHCRYRGTLTGSGVMDTPEANAWCGARNCRRRASPLLPRVTDSGRAAIDEPDRGVAPRRTAEGTHVAFGARAACRTIDKTSGVANRKQPRNPYTTTAGPVCARCGCAAQRACPFCP